MTSKYWSYGGSAKDPLKSYCNGGGSDGFGKENPYDFTLINWNRTLMYDYDHGVLVYGSPQYVLWGLNGLPPAWTGADETALLSKLTSDIRGHDFNAAIFAAEGRESLATVKNSSRAVARLLKNVVTLNLGGTLRALASLPGQVNKDRLGKRMRAGDISGAWLSIQYGWKPLLSDIYEAMKMVEKLTVEPRRIEYRVQHSVSSSWNDSCSSAYNTLPATGKRVSKLKVIYVEQVKVARSLGLLNPAAVLWEKIPFSFVVDWFTPIGSYLDSVSFLNGLNATNTTLVRTDFAIATASGPKACKSWPEIQRITVGGAWKSKSIRFTRSVVTNWAAGYSDYRPGIKSLERALSTGHLQNAAALMHQIIGGMKNSIGRK